MHVFESLDLPHKLDNLVVTIGNYDGIHVGHRAIIERVKQRASEFGGTSGLITFHPHPVHVLRPEQELASITPLEEKKKLVAETGIEALFIIPFTAKFSQIPPETFVSLVLVEKLNVRGVVIGYDFRFGRGGSGDVTLLTKMGTEYGFFVEELRAVTMGGEKIGSNRIRKLVSEGRVVEAEKVLGRPFSIGGSVVRAKGRGRTIGYPTINLKTDHMLIPKNGVYITEVDIDGECYGAVTNVGFNPTFETGQKRTIETFIIDFQGDLYDRDVRIIFKDRIRDEVRFSDIEELKAAIAQDVETARRYFLEENARYLSPIRVSS
jgi:riboflavin kinase / FMN adenylyltransferase